MTRPSLTEAALVGVTIAGLVVGAARWSDAMPGVATPALPAASALTLSPRSTDAALGSVLLEGNPFRHSNRPARVRFGDPPASERPAGNRYRPTLTLKGIVGGPPWTAMVLGVPGRRGSALLGEGERADSLRVQSIDANRVVLVGPDTTWVLILRRDRP